MENSFFSATVKFIQLDTIARAITLQPALTGCNNFGERTWLCQYTLTVPQGSGCGDCQGHSPGNCVELYLFHRLFISNSV